MAEGMKQSDIPPALTGNSGKRQLMTGSIKTATTPVLILIGFLWLGYLIFEEHDKLPLLLSLQEGASWRLISVLSLAVLASLPAPFAFCMMIRQHSGKPISFIYASRLWFVAQIIRHLPGRFWGVVYQANVVQAHIAPTSIVRANFDMMLVGTIWAVMMPAAILYRNKIGLISCLILLVTGCGILGCMLHGDSPGRVMRATRNILPERWQRLLPPVAQSKPYNWRYIIFIHTGFFIAWTLDIVIWNFFGSTFEALKGLDMMALCAIYSLAWLVGFISMATPGGLGIREATFVALGAPFAPAPALALLAIFARLWLLCIDILMFSPYFFVSGEYSEK